MTFDFRAAALGHFQEKGWLSPGGKQRTDSTHVLSAIRERNRLEALTEMLRATLNAIASVEPEWLQGWVPQEWFKRYGRAIDDYHLPKKKEERIAYGELVGQDGMELIGPVRPDSSWQAKEQDAYDSSCFAIDWERQVVTCPEGHLSQRWRPRLDKRRQTPVISVDFAKSTCLECPNRGLCTRSVSAPRSLTLQPQEYQEALP